MLCSWLACHDVTFFITCFNNMLSINTWNEPGEKAGLEHCNPFPPDKRKCEYCPTIHRKWSMLCSTTIPFRKKQYQYCFTGFWCVFWWPPDLPKSGTILLALRGVLVYWVDEWYVHFGPEEDREWSVTWTKNVIWKTKKKLNVTTAGIKLATSAL